MESASEPRTSPTLVGRVCLAPVDESAWAEVVERYGAGKAIVLARFIPIVRTFLNPLVGASNVPARTFVLWNVVGGVLWGTGVTLLGYWLGQVDVIGKNLEVFAVLVVILSVIPMALELRRTRRS